MDYTLGIPLEFKSLTLIGEIIKQLVFMLLEYSLIFININCLKILFVFNFITLPCSFGILKETNVEFTLSSQTIIV